MKLSQVTPEILDLMTDEEIERLEVDDIGIPRLWARAKILRDKFWDDYEEIMKRGKTCK